MPRAPKAKYIYRRATPGPETPEEWREHIEQKIAAAGDNLPVVITVPKGSKTRALLGLAQLKRPAHVVLDNRELYEDSKRKEQTDGTN